MNSGGAKICYFKDPKIQFPCPLKCVHKVAFGSAQNCHNFRVKSTKKERQEKVLKFFLCRKCLKAASKVKHESMADCKAPDCSICGKNHHKLICPEEEREQKTHKIDEDENQNEKYVEKIPGRN